MYYLDFLCYRELHKYFPSALAEEWVLPAHEVAYDVPEAFRVSERLRGRLPTDPPLELLTDENLFWVFYNLCAQMAQMVAAKEL